MNDKPLGEQLGWLLQHSSYIYRGRWFNLRQDDFVWRDSTALKYTYIEHPGSVFVVPVTPEGCFLLMRSYRFTIDQWCWEIPAGTMADADGLAPSQVAVRELREEIGAESEELLHIGRFFLGNGHARHVGDFFLAINTRLKGLPNRNPSEHIAELRTVTPSEIGILIKDGTVNDADSAFALLLALSHLNGEGRSNARLFKQES